MGSACASSSARRPDVPILFVSAKSDPPDRVVGLRIGADDYMGKPFDNNELVARVEALLRRRSHAAIADRDRRQLRFGTFHHRSRQRAGDPRRHRRCR